MTTRHQRHLRSVPLPFFICAAVVFAQNPMTGRDDYNEIRATSAKTHALNRYSDE